MFAFFCNFRGTFGGLLGDLLEICFTFLGLWGDFLETSFGTF